MPHLSPLFSTSHVAFHNESIARAPVVWERHFGLSCTPQLMEFVAGSRTESEAFCPDSTDSEQNERPSRFD